MLWSQVEMIKFSIIISKLGREPFNLSKFTLGIVGSLITNLI